MFAVGLSSRGGSEQNRGLYGTWPAARLAYMDMINNEATQYTHRNDTRGIPLSEAFRMEGFSGPPPIYKGGEYRWEPPIINAPIYFIRPA